MLIQEKELNLPEGNFIAEVQTFQKEDGARLFEMFQAWRQLSLMSKNFAGRGINLPEIISEGVYCIVNDAYRMNNLKIGGADTSLDCYEPKKGVGKNRVQIKATTIQNDCTSFGPKTQWDKLIFADFYNDGNIDGTFTLYEIPDINNIVLNKKKNETVKIQKSQGRRPRFSIKKEFIETNKYLSKRTYKITSQGIQVVS